MSKNKILAICACTLITGPSWGQVLQLDKIETEDVRLLYLDPLQTHLVPHIARSYENSLDFQKSVLGWEPWDKTTLLLVDFSDYGNAGASAVPFNRVVVEVSPPSHTFENKPGSERFFALMNHELVHVASMDSRNTTDEKWRRFFGGKPRESNKHPESIVYSYLAAPRFSSPRWYAEGSAVFVETWMASGVGRAQGGYDEMVFRAMVRDKASFYSAMGLVSKGSEVNFMVGANAYLYGTRFFSYLAYHYTPEQVVQWLRRDEDSKRYYASQFQQVFGKSLEDAWDDWIAFEHEFQEANLQRVREFPLTPTERQSPVALGSMSKAFVEPERRTLVGAFRYPGKVAHIGVLSLDTGEVEHVTDIKGPMLYRVTSTAFDPESRTVFYTADNGSFRDLMSVNLNSGEKQMLMKDARIGDLVFNHADRSLWGLRHQSGYVTLVRIPHPYDDWEQVHTWPYGEDLFEIDISPDGSLLSTSMSELEGAMHLRVFRTEDLLTSRIEPVMEMDFGLAIPEGFVFSPDGKYLYGSSYYTGVSNIFRVDAHTGDWEAVSNAETGFFRPMPLDDGRLMVFEYTGEGFVPTLIDPQPLEDVGSIRFLGNEIATRHPVVRDWSIVSTLSDHDLEDMASQQGKYHPMRELTYSSGYPVIEGYRDEVALGYHFQWEDPVQMHRLDFTASYSWDTPSDEDVHVNLEYHGMNWWGRYWHNDADFYDLFGPTERARKGDAFMLGYDKVLIFDDPRRLDLETRIAYYTGLDTLPNNQNRPTFFFEDILTAHATLNYSDTRKSLGAVDHEKGWRWHLRGQVDHTEFDTIPKVRGGIDFGFALPWKHASVWFYNYAGWADGNRLDPLSNYYFGGFGNNYVDDKEVKRYRDYYSMPGFEIDEIGGREFGKITAEFNFPPIRFAELGTPSFFLKHIRPAIFAMGLVTDPGKGFERNFYSLGFQLDLEFTLTHRLPMTLSVGYAAGYQDSDKQGDEWMVSLKIL